MGASAIKAKDQDYFPRILEAIEAGRSIVLLTHYASDTCERVLDITVAALLQHYDRPELQGMLYTCVKELIVNATKTNAKRMYFSSTGLSVDDEAEYAAGMAAIKTQLSEEWVRKYGIRAREANLSVRVVFHHGPRGLRIEVINNLGLIPWDEVRIRRKMESAMKYEDLISFYADHADQTEGEGIGLAMVLLLLRGEQINPALFRVGLKDGRTMARLEIPFTEQFESVRGPDPAGYTQR